MKMWQFCGGWLHSLIILLLAALGTQHSQALAGEEKSKAFLSPEFVLGPGSVENKVYQNLDFPRGHIAIKDFQAEVVDEAGSPVPLLETYLHHWVVARYYQRKDDSEAPEYNSTKGTHNSDFISVRNSGICQNTLGQYFGLGSETRQTATHVPDPYGIEVGNPAEIPDGYEEKWLLNVHAIDTRGVEDRLGCTKCRCDLYNVTEDAYGRPLSSNYEGGLRCCYDKTQCRVKEGFEGTRRSLYLRYTVKWVDWDSSVVPVKIYIFDITDTWKRPNASTDHSARHTCLVEYEVESCSVTGETEDGCVDVKRTSLTMPTGGHVIYGVSHQHAGGIGSALYGEDGRVICSSMPIYGEGMEAGNEAGYIVGMSTCYPQPGSVKISDGETLILESNYSSTQKHTGVMGLFYILVAEPSPKPSLLLHAPFHIQSNIKVHNSVWAVALLGMAIVVAAVVGYHHWKQTEDGYQAMGREVVSISFLSCNETEIQYRLKGLVIYKQK